MEADVERRTRHPHEELLWEVVLTERATRRPVEFELIRRCTSLALTALLPIVGVILVLIGEPYARQFGWRQRPGVGRRGTLATRRARPRVLSVGGAISTDLGPGELEAIGAVRGSRGMMSHR